MLAKPGGEQRHASMMTATMNIRSMADVVDVVAMSALRMRGMSYRQAYLLDDGPVCDRFRWRIGVCYQFSRRDAVRRVGLIDRDVEACLLKFFLDIQLAVGLKLP